MSLFDNIELPDTPEINLVRKYLEAQDRKDMSDAAEYFADDIVFNGLVLKANGRKDVAGQIEGFIKQAIEYIELEFVTQIDSGATARVMALYNFKLRPATATQPLCDLITVENGKITRIDNVFDLRKLPPM